jgi:hypothetical protein
MAQVQLADEVFNAAQRRATEAGYPSVEAYITDVLVHDVTDDTEETPNLDHLFTPEVIARLDRISANIKAGGKTYSSEEVAEHFRKKSQTWRENHPE